MVIDWYNFVLDVCAIDVRNHLQPLGGFDNNGSPIVVEIDESYFIGSITAAGLTSVNGFSAQRERPLQDAGGAGPVADTIQQWLLPGTHIMSDGWPARLMHLYRLLAI